MLNIFDYHSHPEQLDHFENKHLIVPLQLVWHIAFHDKKRHPELEHIILKDPVAVYRYANNILKGTTPDNRWPEGEHILLKDPYHAYLYARNVLNHPWKEAEPIIKKDSHYLWDQYLHDFDLPPDYKPTE